MGKNGNIDQLLSLYVEEVQTLAESARRLINQCCGVSMKKPVTPKEKSEQ